MRRLCEGSGYVSCGRRSDAPIWPLGITGGVDAAAILVAAITGAVTVAGRRVAGEQRSSSSSSFGGEGSEQQPGSGGLGIAETSLLRRCNSGRG